MSLKVDIKLPRRNLSMDIKLELLLQGITAIYGPSGCGKTSLLRCIAGLETKVEGRILFDEQVWLDGEYKLPTEERRIGYVFQEASLFTHLNVKQNLFYGYKRAEHSGNHFELEEVVSLLGLEHLLEHQPGMLSGGERQRVAIARAILSNPRILLMDEPLAALDKKSKQAILPYLEKLHQQLKLPILYVSHSEDEIARLADNLIVMKEGEVVAEGSLLEMLSSLDSPFLQLDDCFSLIDCIVSQIDEHYRLADLAFDDVVLRLPSSDLLINQPVRVRVMARDISLCLAPSESTSILNVIPATIIGIRSEDSEAGGQCLVCLKVGNNQLVARVSEYSRHQLKLENSMAVFIRSEEHTSELQSRL